MITNADHSLCFLIIIIIINYFIIAHLLAYTILVSINVNCGQMCRLPKKIETKRNDLIKHGKKIAHKLNTVKPCNIHNIVMISEEQSFY